MKYCGLHQVDDQLQLFLAGVSADVDRRRRAIVVNHVRIAAEEVIDHAIDRLLVAGNNSRREHHRVARLNARVLVIIDRGARQRRHRLALRSADQHANFFRREVANLRGMNQQAVRNLDVAEVLRDLGRLSHGTPDQRDLAAVLEGLVDRQLDAVDRRREARDEQPALGGGENLLELRADGALARRVALALDVGGILKQRQHAFLAVFGKGVQIEEPVVGGRGIDLEVARMNQRAQRRVNGQRHAIHQAVRHLDGIDGERPNLEALAGLDLVELGVVKQAVLFQLALDVSQRELGGVDGNVQLRQQPGQRADVVFVAVGQHHRAHVLAVLDQVAEVGNDDVHAEQLGFGEHESGVDDDDVIGPANGHAIHAEFAESAERYNLEFSYRHLQLSMLAQGRWWDEPTFPPE